jgi:hypothetical protein
MVVSRISGVVPATLAKESAVSEIDTAPAVTGFHHFSPIVSDVEASAQWYERVFRMNRVPVTFPHYGAEQEGYGVLLMDPRSGIAIGLHHHEANSGQPFDERDRAGPHLIRDRQPRRSRRVDGLARRTRHRALRSHRHRQPGALLRGRLPRA